MIYQSNNQRPVKHLSRLLQLALAIASLLVSPWVVAQPKTHEGWYQVELIVVARKDDTGQEHWPTNIKLRYPGDWVELKDPNAPAMNGNTDAGSASATAAVDLTKEAFYLLPASERKLNTQAKHLRNNARFELLFHNAWRQVITNDKNAKAILINGGQKFGQHQALEGSIRLSVATYLEVQTNLWYSEFDLNVGQEIARAWPDIPLRPSYTLLTTNSLSLENNVDLERALEAENQQWANSSFNTNSAAAENTAPEYLTRQIVLLKQERSMRSGEVHYLDHPVLAAIIQITPYTPAN